MIHIFKNLMSMLLALAVLIPMVAAQSTKDQPPDVPPHVWQPVQDKMFLQEVGRQVATSDPLTAVTVFDSRGDTMVLSLPPKSPTLCSFK